MVYNFTIEELWLNSEITHILFSSKAERTFKVLCAIFTVDRLDGKVLPNIDLVTFGEELHDNTLSVVMDNVFKEWFYGRYMEENLLYVCNNSPEDNSNIVDKIESYYIDGNGKSIEADDISTDFLRTTEESLLAKYGIEEIKGN